MTVARRLRRVFRAAAVLHALKLGDALVELVIADGAELEAGQVQCLDARLVVEERRGHRRRADQVAGGDHGSERVARAQLCKSACERRSSARAIGEARELPVKVVEGE